ncbi:MAG: hypothetical protein IPP27_06620 [Bacteroidetes bacterium]|nr:hypothetical protein [Bacteroidota bacterium]
MSVSIDSLHERIEELENRSKKVRKLFKIAGIIISIATFLFFTKWLDISSLDEFVNQIKVACIKLIPSKVFWWSVAGVLSYLIGWVANKLLDKYCGKWFDSEISRPTVVPHVIDTYEHGRKVSKEEIKVMNDEADKINLEYETKYINTIDSYFKGTWQSAFIWQGRPLKLTIKVENGNWYEDGVYRFKIMDFQVDERAKKFSFIKFNSTAKKKHHYL